MRNDYVFPEIFVENTDIESDKYMVVYGKDNIEITNECAKSNKEAKCFAKVSYDEALDIVLDVYGNRIKRSFIIKTKDNNLLLVKSSIDPKIIEIKGWIVRLLITEGEKIKKKQRIAYVLTRKYETRTIRSPWDGIVTYIGYVFGEKPEHYIIVVVDEDDIEYLRKIR